MSDGALTIREMTVRAVDAPLPRPLRTAAGTIPSAPLLLIDIQTEQGVVGRAYIFAYTKTVLAPLARLGQEIAPELAGQAVAPALWMQAFERRFRLLGRQGLLGMLLSGIDMALWDALGRAADCPVVRLLGGAPAALPGL